MNETLMNKLETGYRLHQAGRLADAERCYREVLEADRRNIHALNLMGMLCANDFRPDEAVFYLSLALKKEPKNPETHANIALAYKDQGSLKKAVEHFRQSLRLAPDNPVVMNNLGNVLREKGLPEQAVKVYERALKRQPSFAECWSNLAAALNESDQRKRAHQAVDRALTLNPELAQGHNNRGDILLAEARYDLALASYRKATRLNPKYSAAMINMARAQRDMDDPESAEHTLRQVLELEPRNPEALHVLGVLEEQMGRPEKAASFFQRAIDSAPGMAIAHYYLSQIRGRRTTDEEFAAMRKIWEGHESTPNDRMFLAFGLARALEQRGDYGAAFEFISHGNRIKAEMQPYDDADAAQFMEALADCAESLRTRLGDRAGFEDGRPVFVLGMPRSGTSLTEQVLSSHSQVIGAGELSFAYDMAHRVRDLTGKAFPGNLAELSGEQLKELGAYYMGRHREEHLLGRHVVDKTPLNFQYVGLLGLALPGAKFIHCHRDPVQNCFSIHKMPFDKRQAYAHSLTALGQYYRRYQNLMDRWKALFPGRILDVCYEDTVADIEAQGRGILDFLGLPFEENILDFHKTRRLVKTPSASQVREPIYRDALASWRKYETQLAPLIDALGSSVEDS